MLALNLCDQHIISVMTIDEFWLGLVMSHPVFR